LTVVDIREIISREMMERGREKPLTREDIREIISREMAERGGGEKPLTKEDLGEMIEEATSKEAPIEAPPKEVPSIENQIRQVFLADREERKKQDESLRPAREAQEKLGRRMDELLVKIERGELSWMNEESQPEKPKPVPSPSEPPKITEATPQIASPSQPVSEQGVRHIIKEKVEEAVAEAFKAEEDKASAESKAPPESSAPPPEGPREESPEPLAGAPQEPQRVFPLLRRLRRFSG